MAAFPDSLRVPLEQSSKVLLRLKMLISVLLKFSRKRKNWLMGSRYERRRRALKSCIFSFSDRYTDVYGHFPESLRLQMLKETREMFTFGYDSYMKFAFPLDELDPIHCSGKFLNCRESWMWVQMICRILFSASLARIERVKFVGNRAMTAQVQFKKQEKSLQSFLVKHRKQELIGQTI